MTDSPETNSTNGHNKSAGYESMRALPGIKLVETVIATADAESQGRVAEAASMRTEILSKHVICSTRIVPASDGKDGYCAIELVAFPKDGLRLPGHPLTIETDQFGRPAVAGFGLRGHGIASIVVENLDTSNDNGRMIEEPKDRQPPLNSRLPFEQMTILTKMTESGPNERTASGHRIRFQTASLVLGQRPPAEPKFPLEDDSAAAEARGWSESLRLARDDNDVVAFIRGVMGIAGVDEEAIAQTIAMMASRIDLHLSTGEEPHP